MSDPTPRLERFESYVQACREFRWLIPPRLNIATAICRRHQDAVTRIAVSDVKQDGINTYTFGGLDFLSDKFATALCESGIRQGDAVAVVLPPSAALAVAHLGALKAGAVVVPLSKSADAGLLEYALTDVITKALVVDESIYSNLETVARNLRHLESRFVVRDLRPAGVSSDYKDFWSAVDSASSDFESVEHQAAAPAFIFYIELEGAYSGVVHSHRSIIGQFAAFEMFNNADPNSVFWAVGDWSSSAAVLGVLYPAWWYGCSLAGTSDDRAGVLDSIKRGDVTHTFLEPAQLEPFAESSLLPGDRSGLALRTVVVGATRSQEYLVSGELSVKLNQVYGRPETGWIYGRCDRWFEPPIGSVGRSAPGRTVEVIDEAGEVVPAGQAGHIAVHKSDPGLFTRYHRGPAETPASFIGDWFVTGDIGYKNGDGDLYLSPSPSVAGRD